MKKIECPKIPQTEEDIENLMNDIKLVSHKS